MGKRVKYFAEIEGVSITLQSLIWNEKSKARSGSFTFEVWDPEPAVIGKLKPSRVFELWIGYVEHDVWHSTTKTELEKLSGIIIMPQRKHFSGKVLYTVEGVDRSAAAHNHIVNKSYSNKRPDEIAIDAWSVFGPPGITFNKVNTATGMIESIQFPHDTLFQVMEELSDFTGWPWRIDAHGDLFFRGADDDFYGVITQDDIIKGTADFKDDSTQLANRVWVFGAFIEADDITESFVGNNEQHTFKLAYSPIFESVWVLRGGVGQTVGQDGVDSFDSHNVLVNTITQVLRFNPDTPPSSATLIQITYRHGYPVISRREDAGSIAEFGLHEHVIVDAKIRSNAVAAEIARAHIREFSRPSKQAECQIYKTGIRAGQAVNIKHAGHGIDTVYTVDEVDREIRGPEDVVITIKLRASPGTVSLESKVRELDQRIHSLETKDIPRNAPVNTYQDLRDDVDITDALNLIASVPESRVGYAIVGYSEIG